MEAVICGIDPGLRTTGYAVTRASANGVAILDAGVCRLDPDAPLEQRLSALDHDVSAMLTEFRPDIVAVEKLYAHYKHPTTAILMGHARGVIFLAAARHGGEVRSFASTQVKRHLTGNGRASKSQMQRAVQTAFSLPELPEPHDMADALALALCCYGDLQAVHLAEASR